jgi:hypothetical protein
MPSRKAPAVSGFLSPGRAKAMGSANGKEDRKIATVAMIAPGKV